MNVRRTEQSGMFEAQEWNVWAEKADRGGGRRQVEARDAKLRRKMAKMRPKMTKMRPNMAKMRLKMVKMRPKMAKMRLKMAKMRPIFYAKKYRLFGVKK